MGHLVEQTRVDRQRQEVCATKTPWIKQEGGKREGTFFHSAAAAAAAAGSRLPYCASYFG